MFGLQRCATAASDSPFSSHLWLHLGISRQKSLIIAESISLGPDVADPGCCLAVAQPLSLEGESGFGKTCSMTRGLSHSSLCNSRSVKQHFLRFGLLLGLIFLILVLFLLP